MSFARFVSLPRAAQSFTRCRVAPSRPMTNTLRSLFTGSPMLQFIPEMPETGIISKVPLEGFHKTEGCFIDVFIIVLHIDRRFYIGFISAALHCNKHRHHRGACLCGQCGRPYGCLLYTSDAADDLLCVDL